MVSQSELKRLLEYDENAKNCLIWKSSGKEAGCPKGFVSVRGSKVKSELIVWLLHHNCQPSDVLVKLVNSNLKPTLLNLEAFSKKDAEYCHRSKRKGLWANIFYEKCGVIYWKVDNFKSCKGVGYRLLNRKDEPLYFRLNSEGYKRFELETDFGSYHNYARVVWILNKGDIQDGLQVDHINGNRTDNRIENLRLVTPFVNARNNRRLKTNTSGVTGVHYSKDGYWTARYVDLEGVRRTKKFSIGKLGYKEAFHSAVRYRLQKLDEVNSALGEEGYTKRHMQSQEV